MRFEDTLLCQPRLLLLSSREMSLETECCNETGIKKKTKQNKKQPKIVCLCDQTARGKNKITTKNNFVVQVIKIGALSR